jgi:hypothetical protein
MIVQHTRDGEIQRLPFILSIRVWPSAVLRIKSSYHHQGITIIARRWVKAVQTDDETVMTNFRTKMDGIAKEGDDSNGVWKMMVAASGAAGGLRADAVACREAACARYP